MFSASVDEHLMSIVSLDGITVKASKPIQGIVLNPGQRVIVNICPATTSAAARAVSRRAFWLRAEMLSSIFPNATTDSLGDAVPDDLAGVPRYGTALAVVQYGSDLGPKLEALPTSAQWIIPDPKVGVVLLPIHARAAGSCPRALSTKCFRKLITCYLIRVWLRTGLSSAYFARRFLHRLNIFGLPSHMHKGHRWKESGVWCKGAPVRHTG